MDFTLDPSTSSRLLVHDTAPLNAEPLLPELIQHELTPAPLVYARNHGTCSMVTVRLATLA
jgi:hypothetical protein